MSAFNFRHASLLAIMLMGLSACATVDEPRGAPTAVLDWPARQQVLASLSDWRAVGRVAMQTTDDAWSASIDWDQIAERYEIRLSGPLGGNAMTIIGGPGYVVLETAEGDRYIETNAGRLIESKTGWHIPVEGLKYWALGLTEPGQPADQVFDDKGRLTELRQSGWVIRYQAYRLMENIEMPRKIQLANNHFKVKLVIKDWHFGLHES